MSALAFRSAIAAVTDFTKTAPSISVGVPSGEVQNDLDLIPFLTLLESPGTPAAHNTPSGYELATTSGVQPLDGAYNARISVFGRLAPSSPGAVTVSPATTGSYMVGWRMAYDNPHLLTPYVKASSWVLDTDPSSGGGGISVGPLATETFDALLIAIFYDATTLTTWSTPSGMASRINAGNGFAVFDVIQPVKGSSGTKNSNSGSSGGDAIGVLLEFASETQSFNYTASGGLSLGGASTVIRSRVKVGVGGLTFAGSAARLRGAVRTSSGGITVAGAASFAKGRGVTPTGGAQFGGAAALTRARVIVAQGGLTISGAAGYVSSALQQFSYTASGGLSLGGSAAAARGRAAAPTGGPQFGGAASVSFHVASMSYAGSGGLVFGGSALVSFHTEGLVLQASMIGPSSGMVSGGDLAGTGYFRGRGILRYPVGTESM